MLEAVGNRKRRIRNFLLAAPGRPATVCAACSVLDKRAGRPVGGSRISLAFKTARLKTKLGLVIRAWRIPGHRAKRRGSEAAPWTQGKAWPQKANPALIVRSRSGRLL